MLRFGFADLLSEPHGFFLYVSFLLDGGQFSRCKDFVEDVRRTKGVPVRIHQWRSPALELNTLRIDEGAQRTHFFIPQGQSVGAFSDNRLWESLAELRFLHLDGFGASAQATLGPSMIPFATFLVQTRDDAFSRAITNFLLVRQQL